MTVIHRISPQQKTQNSKKRVVCSMNLSKEQYISVFGKLGTHKDLCRLILPPKDGMLLSKCLQANL